MKSLIPGYEYDIFISYRQKDNKHDGWVTEFVDNLKGELESTFKDEISVYFDVNPHDGLLETHDVDASLKEKLKCLVFIPIISHTYCDPKSFAWEHELKAFAEQASKDQFGLMIKLPNGNVASRILPVRIHEITDCDVKLFETIIGSYLRGVEFIYKEPGVNRPLRSNEENPNTNLNHTIYRNQINKVANAIQEVLLAIQHPGQKTEPYSKDESYHRPVSGRRKKIKLISGAVFAIALIVSGILFSQKLFKTDKWGEKSIAVLPFYSLSADSTNQYLADGMMDAMLTHLSKINDIRVMSRTSVEQYRKTKKTSTEIGKELDVAYLLEGSFQKVGDSIRLIVQLIRTGKEGHVWANIYDRPWNNVFSVQSEVSKMIASELKGVLTPGEIEKISEKPTENLEAYQAYLRGRYYADQPHFSLQDWNQALLSFQDAADIDTTFALAYGELARAHARLIFLRQDMSESRLEKAKQAASKALRLGYDQPKVQLAIGYYYLYAFRDKAQALKHFEIAEKGLPNDVDVLIGKAENIVTQGRWEEHIQLLEKALKMSPKNITILTDLAKAYLFTRRFSDAINMCNEGIALSPNSTWPYLYKSFSYRCWKGPVKESRDPLRNIPKTHEWYLWSWYSQELAEGNLGKALEIADSTKEWGVNNKMWAIPKTSILASIYDYQNKRELAISNYKVSIEALGKRLAKTPADPRYHTALGIAYAGIGKNDEAIQEGLKGVQLLPLEADAIYGISGIFDLAVIYTMVGQNADAIDCLNKLLSIPCFITPPWLQCDIRLAPLRLDPAYDKLMAKYPVNK